MSIRRIILLHRKKFLLLFALFPGLYVQGQGPHKPLEVVQTVMRFKYSPTGNVALVRLVDSALIAYQLQQFTEPETAVFKLDKEENADSLILTLSEKAWLAHQLRAAAAVEWTNAEFSGINLISFDSLQVFLPAERGNEVFLLSRPVFFRENLCFLFVAHFCCGGIYGFMELGFYRLENGVWKRWIQVVSGAF